MAQRLILVGFVLVLAGAVVPFLMVIRVLPQPLWLSVASYVGSVVGVFLGLIGAATLFSVRKHKLDAERLDEPPDEPHLPLT